MRGGTGGIIALLNNAIYGRKNKKNLNNTIAAIKRRQNAAKARLAAKNKNRNGNRR